MLCCTLITPSWQQVPLCAILDIIFDALAPHAAEQRDELCWSSEAARAWHPDKWLIKPQVVSSLADSTYERGACCAVQLGSPGTSARAIRVLWSVSSLPSAKHLSLLINRLTEHNIVPWWQGCYGLHDEAHFEIGILCWSLHNINMGW